MFTEINGIKIHYIDEGTGQPVLLLHGWGSCIENWNPVMQNLRGRFRIVALDFPGCGQSGLPAAPLVLEDYLSLVVTFCKQLHVNQPIIMGHSHGGRTAIALIARGLLQAKKAVLFDSAGIKSPNSLKKSFKIASFKTVKFVLTLPGVKPFTEDALNRARAHFGSSDYNQAPQVMRKTLVSLVNTDLTDELPKINCPTLLIWGSNDTATPLKDGKTMEKLIPDAGLCVLKGCGHFSYLERPVDTCLILNSFLN